MNDIISHLKQVQKNEIHAEVNWIIQETEKWKEILWVSETENEKLSRLFMGQGFKV